MIKLEIGILDTSIVLCIVKYNLTFFNYFFKL